MNARRGASWYRNRSERLALGLTILGIAGRLVPHPPNFTPVGASALFAGARLQSWRAYAVPVVTMALSALLLPALFGLPAFPKITPFLYASLLLNVFVGKRLCARPPAHASGRIRTIGLGALVCSLQFFVVTNLGVWLLGSFYPHSVAGLSGCYLAALPFYARTLAGDCFYAAALFGLDAWFARLSRAPSPANPNLAPTRSA